MFNREYQKRATRQGIRSFLATSSFYRPAQRPDPRSIQPKKLTEDQQLSFDFDAKHCPLSDVFPEAYE